MSSSTTFYAIWEPNTLVVFEQVNTSRDGGTVTTYNRNYVNMTNTRCAAWIWYSLGSESQTETININYGNYKTATINYWMDTNNTDVFWEGDRRADFHIDGLGVFSSTDWDKTAPYTYSHTISKPSVQLRVDVENSDWDGTWVEGFLYPTKITLNK